MPMTAISAYIGKLPAMQASLCLLLSSVVSLPHLKQGERQRMLDQWRVQSEGTALAPIRPTRAMLQRMGIGVRRHGPKPG